jgi:hypothetical protein
MLTTPLSKDPQTSSGPPAAVAAADRAWSYSASAYTYVLPDDPGNSADSSLYTWSELGLTPVDWCRFSLVVQRTKACKTEFDIQRSFFAGVGVSF